jgi:hypothetical protein
MNVIEETAPNYWIFWCPGCECCHSINETWTFNGDLAKPTIRPSLLSTFGRASNMRCHLFVEDGKLRFLKDSTHPLAGRTIDMKPLPWNKTDG